ncbi:MAG TPA: polysaccharide pyruvyl transferase CsaB [Oscillatoriales cyanobacterium M59_W2019_021]|nr:polysaccharide pyruvyl transferase CsaB [Oscillatoriales cyanobacterium M4454_W2019_049]HIK52225.1 polysaccharide pyruvyl transferase CsaB [Oscillatoriales cyanobacterium M59_W2019_021]
MGQMRGVLCGYYGMGNGGDEALLASLLQMLPECVTPVVLSGNPKQTRDRYQVEVCPRKSLRVLPLLRRSDLLIWGGGSLVQDATSALNPLYYTGLMGLAQGFGLQTIAWAQGIGPLNRSLTKWVARRAFSGCQAVSVRDRASAFQLQEWNVPALLAPDPVWALESLPVKGLWDLPAPRVAVTLRSHPKLTPQRLETLTRAVITVQKATGALILLLPFQPSQDLEIARFLHDRLAGNSQILSLTDPRQLKGVFQGVEMAIGMRLHSLIMAAAEGCRCFALSYDPKIDRLREELEMPGWKMDDIPEDANEIARVWLEQYANGSPLRRDRIASLVDRALMHRELLREALRSLRG